MREFELEPNIYIYIYIRLKFELAHVLTSDHRRLRRLRHAADIQIRFRSIHAYICIYGPRANPHFPSFQVVAAYAAPGQSDLYDLYYILYTPIRR